MEFNNQPHIIIDIGGGSTELILGDSQEPRSLTSTKVGAVRLTSEINQHRSHQRIASFSTCKLTHEGC